MTDSFASINPVTMEVIERYDGHSPERLDKILQSVQDRYATWRTTSLQERSDHLLAVAERLEQDRSALARLITDEMGKPLRQSEAEIDKCAWVCRHYAEQGSQLLADRRQSLGQGREAIISYQGLGAILAVMPWNFPFWQVFRFAAPNLMLGNTCLLKHAANVSGCALAIEDLIAKAGLPEHCFRTLLIDNDATQRLIADPRVKAVTLTGSTRAGSAVAASAGRARKKSVLELGGSDPYLVLDDADLELAATLCVNSRLINSGQSCIAAKRFIVASSVAAAFTELVIERMRAKKLGDPKDDDCDIGPLARADLAATLQSQLEQSVAAGAKLAYAADNDQDSPCYVPAAILDQVRPGMAAFDEEVFAPVAAIIQANSEKELVHLANASRFGLGGAIFSRDIEKASFLAREELELGCCAINDFVKSDPRIPFGGIKDSGFGRELGAEGIYEFANIKSIVRPSR